MRQRLQFLLFIGIFLVSASNFVYAQHAVSGVVTSSGDGATLPGTNILVKGTSIGTAADASGAYSLVAPSRNDTLVFSFVGYVPQEVGIAGRATVDVALVASAFLDEVVVVGYGTQEKRDVTGAITSITTREVLELPISDVSEALQGRASGVVALRSGSLPGDDLTVRVRGRRSLTASNDPLFVIDGIPVIGGINSINTADIESMQILKDASATAIYGSRGANGVVIINTNRGANQKTTVSYSSYYGVSQELGRVDMMNGAEYAELKREGYRRNGQDPELALNDYEKDLLARGIETVWLDEILSDGHQMNHQLSVRGGSDRTQFYLSGSYYDEQALQKNQSFSRGSFRLNLDHRINDWIRVGTSTQVGSTTRHWPTNLYGGSISLNPLSTPYEEDGSFTLFPGGDPLLWNPLTDFVKDANVDDRTTLRLFGNVYAELDLLEGLKYRMNFGPDIGGTDRGWFQATQGFSRRGDSPRAGKDMDQRYAYTLENIFTYDKTLNSVHDVNVTGLWSIQKSRTETTTIDVQDLPYETQLYNNLGTGTSINDYGSNLTEWGLMSFMGRINYQFQGKYLLTLTGRFDGSSRLAEGNKWGFFPSVGLGWLVSDESFMQNQNLFTELKLRGSWGSVGNTGINPYTTAGSLAAETYVFGGTPGPGYRPSGIANPDLKWEVSSTINVGIDFGMFRDRVTGSLEVYQTKTTDLLLSRQLPPTSGFSSVLENIGETQNTGWEISLATRNIQTPDLSWTTEFSLFGNKEKIVDLYGDKQDDVGNRWFIGEPLTVYYDYDQVGIWQLGEEAEAARYGQIPGDIHVKDVNDDGLINNEDSRILGSNIPDLTLGFTTRLRYKMFDFSAFLFGSFGQTVNNNFMVGNTTLQARYNNLNVNYWTPDNPANTHPRPNNLVEYPLYTSARGYEDGSFLKVRNVQLGYTLPSSLLNQYGIRYMRVYVNANSPLVFSSLSTEGVDPEIYSGSVSAGNMPSSKLWSFGVDITF